jgi:hypothetical protein
MSKSCGCKKMKGGGMALFKGKESYGEELKEAKALKSNKISKKQFVKGEKSEGHKDEENPSLIAKEIKSGAMSPKQYASVEAKEKKMAFGGAIGAMGNAANAIMARGAANPSMVKPAGAPAGRAGAAAPGAINTTPNARSTMMPPAPQKSAGLGMLGRMAQPGPGTIRKAKGGSVSSRADGCAVRGKTKGKII